MASAKSMVHSVPVDGQATFDFDMKRVWRLMQAIHSNANTQCGESVCKSCTQQP